MTGGAASPRSRARRRAVAIALAVAAALVLPPVVLFVALRVPAVRARLLESALARAREATGLSLTARELEVDAWGGTLRLRGLAAAVPGAPPFAEGARADADLDLGEARHGRLRLRRLTLEGVRVDLGAPRPASKGTSTRDLGFLSAAEIEEIDVGIASVSSGPLPPSIRRVATGAGLGGGRVRGSLRGGTLRLRADLRSAFVDRPGPLRLTTTGVLALSATAAGAVTLEELRLAGDGLWASASGTFGFPPESPISLHAELRALPAKVAPELRTTGEIALATDVTGTASTLSADLAVDGRDLTTPAAALRSISARGRFADRALVVKEAAAELLPSGRVTGEGRFDLASGEGTWSLRAERLPDALLRAYADDATRARRGIAGSEVDATATIRHGAGDPLPLSIDAELTCRRGTTPLASATARLISRGRTTLAFDATFLPSSAGERGASGALEASSLAGLASGRLVDGRVRARVPDLAVSFAEVRGLLPTIVPEVPGGIDLSGPFRLDVSVSGPLRAPLAVAQVSFAPSSGGAMSLSATADAGRRSIEGSASATGVALGALHSGTSGLASADARFAVGNGRRDARVDLDAAGLCLAEGAPLVDSLHAALEVDGRELRVLELEADSGAWPRSPFPEGLRVVARGRASLAAPFRDADLSARFSALTLSAEANAIVRDGVLSVEVPHAGRPGLEGFLSARLPLGALRDIPEIASYLPAGLPTGPLDLTLDAPGIDSCVLESVLPKGTPVVALAGDLRAFATLPLDDLLGGTAQVEVEGLSAQSPAGRLSALGPVRATLGGGRLALEPVTVAGERTSFRVSASADLVPGARAGAPLRGFLSHVTGAAEGRADASLLTPFLFGGSASGEIAVDARVSGPPDALVGHVLLDGRGSRLSWPLAWPTEIRDPLLETDLTPGVATLTRGEALLNEGPVLVSGGWYGGVGTTLTALFTDVRYRLSYGLAAVLSGELTLDLVEGKRRVSGNVTLERGLLERDIDLDRELLARILAPPEAAGTEASFLDTLALDFGVGTTSGIRIRNNVADLAASWSRLDVTGTAARPVVRGSVDVEKNGLVFAYGQTFRIDRGVVTYTGDPATDPRLDFLTTSSLQDRTIGGAAAGDVFAEARVTSAERGSGDDAAAQLAYGLAGYYGDRLASTLGAALGRVSLAVKPFLLLGETDPASRLTLSRELSPTVSLAVGIDLKNAQRQTWVVDVHGLRRLPPLAAQLFTEDYGRYGGTLQQRIELGGTLGRGDGESGEPVLGRIDLAPPPGVSRRALVSAMRLRKGDRAGRAALFEAEIDAEAWLRSRGFPEAQVALRAVAAAKAGRVDVKATVDPGPRVEVVFEGDPPPKAPRTKIAGLYRTGALEAEAFEEMRRETARALRAQGHLAPEVEVSAGGSETERRVVVTTTAGPKAEIREVVFEGVSAREAEIVARRFTAPLERIELAAALPSADERLLEALRGLAYPYGRIDGRSLSGDGRLTLRLDPGPPSLVESVSVRGVAPEEAGRLSRLVRLVPGENADADRTALSALAMEDALRAGGFSGARVKSVLSPATPEDPPRLSVVFDVEQGVPQHLGSVTLEGLSRTSPGWARRVAGLEPGSVFRREEIDEARASLFSLGLFRSVRGDLAPGPDGRVDVVLKAEELPPVTLAYGLRWENERGFAAVLDAVDRNLLGRGLTLGVRALYDPEDRALRLFAGVPERVLGAGVDVWVERRRSIREGLLYGRRTDSTEASLQLSRSLGRFLQGRFYGRFKETRLFEDDLFFPVDVTIRLPYAGAQLVWDTRQDPLLGTNGILASLDVQGSGSWLNSSFAFGRAYGQVNLYRPLLTIASGRVVWAQSVRAGFARPFEGQELIPDVRFYAGGSYSVRGYPTESLGPREELGGTLFVTGGSTLLVVNEELRVPLHPRLLGVAFFDAGQVWESSRDFGTGLATSVGLGVRALTPLGVLRLDSAFPLNRREGDPSWRLSFGFGNVF